MISDIAISSRWASRRAPLRMSAGSPRATIAILPAGDVAEDWLEPLGLSIETFLRDVRHGWLFGFTDALSREGVRCVLVFVSRRESAPRLVSPGGFPATTWVLPEPRAAAVTRVAPIPSRRLAARVLNAPIHRIRPYVSTPVQRLADVLTRERCDSLLCAEYELPRFDVSIALGRRLGIPVFATHQGISKTATFHEAVVRRITVPRAAGFVVGSSQEAERLVGQYGVSSDRIEQLPNPLDTEYWSPTGRDEARQHLAIAEEELVVAWHGRVELETKGLDLLLAAWMRLLAGNRQKTARLHLMGTGPDAGRLRDLIAKLGPARVHWDARFSADPAVVRTFLRAADVYVIPSRREGMPVAALEAMSCGLPVIATAAANARGLFGSGRGQTGGIEVAEDSSEIASALSRLLTDTGLRKRSSDAARTRAIACFDTSVVAPALADFLTHRP